MRFAVRCLRSIESEHISTPQIDVLADGSVTLEWTSATRCLKVMLRPSGEILVYRTKGKTLVYGTGVVHRRARRFEALREGIAWLYFDANKTSILDMFALAEIR